MVSDTICNYDTEFLIYIVNAPLTTTHYNTITVIVGKWKPGVPIRWYYTGIAVPVVDILPVRPML